MEESLELAGYYCAHAVWCVSDGETLIPMLATARPERPAHMRRFEGEELQECVARARAALESNPDGDAVAAVLYDAYVNLPEGKTDAIVVEATDYASGSRTVVAIPYRHASHPGGFAVFCPRVLALPHGGDLQSVADALRRGIGKHEKAAEVWSRYLDESR